MIESDAIRTGVTIIRPHEADPYLRRCPCAVHVGNGYGKLTGALQIEELGELESLIGLTNTLSVPAVMQGILDYHLPRLPKRVVSINVVVGETNDAMLNDIRGRQVGREHVQTAIENCSDQVGEGAVGAGTGTMCFGYKGGIGTASRVVPGSLLGEEKDFTLGILVQSNYGGSLTIYGHPIAQHPSQPVGGSCMLLLATDAPVEARQLKRLAKRTMVGLGRTGSVLGHSSGDFCIAFSNYPPNLRLADSNTRRTMQVLAEDYLTAFFEATVDATMEALYNSLTMSPTVKGFEGRIAEGLDLRQYSDVLPLKRTNSLL
jgi:D-aminopeptidase